MEVDAQRARWVAYRKRQQLHLEAGEQFARGDLGSHVGNLDVRLLSLPADPDRDVVPLGTDALEWFKQVGSGPFHGRSPRWPGDRAVTNALVLFDYYREEMEWVRYLALHRHGGIEIGAGDLSYEVKEMRVIRLRRVVALVWTAVAVQAEVVEKWEIEPPYELTVGVKNTRGAALGGFAEGWPEPGRSLKDPRTCLDEDVLLRWECEELDAESIAMEAGGRLEQAFGTTMRRHCACTGEFEGQFDPRFPD